MIVIDQKISETTPKMLSRDTLTGCGSLGSNSVCNVYSGLVPMSPKTTPRAPSASAPCAAARRLTPMAKVVSPPLSWVTLTNHPWQDRPASDVGTRGVEGGGGRGLAGQGLAEFGRGEDFDVRAEGEQSFGSVERAEAQFNLGPAGRRPGAVRVGVGQVSGVDAPEQGQDRRPDADGDRERGRDVVDAAAQGLPHLGQSQPVAALDGLGQDGGRPGPVGPEQVRLAVVIGDQIPDPGLVDQAVRVEGVAADPPVAAGAGGPA